MSAVSRNFWPAILSLMAALLCLGAGPQDTRIVPGQAVGILKLGQPATNAIGLWGRPSKVDKSPETGTQMVFFPNGMAMLVGKDENILGLTVTKAGYRTPEGVGVGSSAAQIKASYGQGLQRGSGNWTYPNRGIAFSFDPHGTVTHVFVFKTEEDRPLLGDRLVIAGQRAGGLRLGASAQSIQAAWGAPTSQRDLGGGRSLWTYKDKAVRLVVSQGSLDAILIMTGDFITPEGVKIGSTQAQVIAAFGSGFTRRGAGLFYESKGIGFVLGKETVIEMQVLFPRQ